MKSKTTVIPVIPYSLIPQWSKKAINQLFPKIRKSLYNIYNNVWKFDTSWPANRRLHIFHFCALRCHSAPAKLWRVLEQLPLGGLRDSTGPSQYKSQTGFSAFESHAQMKSTQELDSQVCTRELSVRDGGRQDGRFLTQSLATSQKTPPSIFRVRLGLWPLSSFKPEDSGPCIIGQ